MFLTTLIYTFLLISAILTTEITNQNHVKDDKLFKLITAIASKRPISAKDLRESVEIKNIEVVIALLDVYYSICQSIIVKENNTYFLGLVPINIIRLRGLLNIAVTDINPLDINYFVIAYDDLKKATLKCENKEIKEMLNDVDSVILLEEFQREENFLEKEKVFDEIFERLRVALNECGVKNANELVHKFKSKSIILKKSFYCYKNGSIALREDEIKSQKETLISQLKNLKSLFFKLSDLNKFSNKNNIVNSLTRIKNEALFITDTIKELEKDKQRISIADRLKIKLDLQIKEIIDNQNELEQNDFYNEIINLTLADINTTKERMKELKVEMNKNKMKRKEFIEKLDLMCLEFNKITKFFYFFTIEIEEFETLKNALSELNKEIKDFQSSCKSLENEGGVFFNNQEATVSFILKEYKQLKEINDNNQKNNPKKKNEIMNIEILNLKSEINNLYDELSKNNEKIKKFHVNFEESNDEK